MKKNKYNVAIRTLAITLTIYGLSWIHAYAIAPTYQAAQLRELSEIERVKLYLIQKVGYQEYQRWNKIIAAESSWRLDAKNVNKNGTTDGCLLQVNSSWDDEAKKLGLDYRNNPIDCIDMGLYIKEVQGFSAWNASKKKWL